MKLLALLLTILLTFGAVSCQKEPPPDTSMEFNAETDCQYYLTRAGNYPVAETEDGYYYVNNTWTPGFLRFIEMETLQDTILCGKPNCLHTEESEKENCNAFIGDGKWMNIYHYKGDIYTVAIVRDPATYARTYQLTKISKDGSARKKVWDLTWRDQDEFRNLHQDFMHRGKLYFIVYKSVTGDDNPMQMYSYDLKTKKCTPVLTEVQGLDYVVARGDYLFYTAYDPELKYLHAYRYTISTGDIMSFPERRRTNMYSEGILYERIDTFLNFYHTDLEGMNREEFGLSYDQAFAANDKYIVISRTKFIHKETGEEYTYDEYLRFMEFDATGMTPEEEAREFTRRDEQYKVVFDREQTIYDINTLEEIGKVLIPSGLAITYFKGDYLIGIDDDSGLFAMIDFTKLGTDEFKWVTSSNVN